MPENHYEQLRENASIAHKNKLFVKSQRYRLREYLRQIKYANFTKSPAENYCASIADSWDDVCINIAYRDGTAVGVSIINTERKELIAIYVKQAYRRQGIGRSLCSTNDIIECNEGTREGFGFFNKMGYQIIGVCV